MEIIKIKVWGLVSLSKKQIMILELLSLSFFITITIFLFTYDFKPHFDEVSYNFHAKYAKYFSLACTFLIIIEAQYFWSLFTRAQLDVINKQKNELDRINNRVQESIIYASKIQQVLLPSKQKLQRLLKEHFVLHRPRDIVSGDFYWVEEFEGKIIVTVADCTGHGVPGAFVSAMGVSLLNEIVLMSKKTGGSLNPADMLVDLKKRLKYAVENSESENSLSDGMDISICIIDNKKKQFVYAGALNPMIYVKNIKKGDNPELIQLKPDINPLGMGGAFNGSYDYNSQTVDFQDGDMLYLYSDGYIDQFGGNKNKKFSTNKFVKLINRIAKNELPIQLKEMETALNEWQGDIEQIDDITVMGIRL